MRRLTALTIAATILATAPAFAAGVPHGRGPTAQALMLAATVNGGSERVNVLDQLCARPARMRDCSPLRPVLQRALEEAVSTPIRWVSERITRGRDFWVLAPVRFGDPAESEFAWWDGTDQCSGWTRIEWTSLHGAWVETGGVGVVGCSAVP